MLLVQRTGNYRKMINSIASRGVVLRKLLVGLTTLTGFTGPLHVPHLILFDCVWILEVLFIFFFLSGLFLR